MNRRQLITVFAALLGSVPLHAQNILVASSRSNSIEEFGFTTATARPSWIRTFATTGPYSPIALAQSPKTGEIFVTTTWGSGPYAGQLTNRILRYQSNGAFDVNWDSFPIVSSSESCPNTDTQSLLFDAFGNLYVATAYGFDQAGHPPICIFKYLAADLTGPNPLPQPGPILVSPWYRGNQMAFNTSGNLCITGFIDENVKCFNTSTGSQTADYYSEIHAAGLGIEPVGLAFDSANRLYLTSVFTGQVVKETAPGGPIVLLATLTSPPNQLDGNLVLHTIPDSLVFPISSPPQALYTSAFSPAPPLATFSVPDPVYEISPTSGAEGKIIYETAPPALGNDHIWGGYWMIFTSSPGLTLIPFLF